MKTLGRVRRILRANQGPIGKWGKIRIKTERKNNIYNISSFLERVSIILYYILFSIRVLTISQLFPSKRLHYPILSFISRT